jgi:hypothetical protein
MHNLSDYTLAELRGLLFDIGNAIRDRERRQVDDARARAHAIAQAAGVALDALVGDDSTTTRRKKH